MGDLNRLDELTKTDDVEDIKVDVAGWVLLRIGALTNVLMGATMDRVDGRLQNGSKEVAFKFANLRVLSDCGVCACQMSNGLRINMGAKFNIH